MNPNNSTSRSPAAAFALAPLTAGLLLVLLVAAANANSLRGAFVFDDITGIVENPHLARLWPPGRALTAPPDTTPAGRPLVSLSLAVNYALGGLATPGYHWFNIAVHGLAALTLFGLVRRALALPGVSTAWGAGGRAGFAFAVAALWALHPVQTEAVTYVSQRAESMTGLCYLLTLYAALRGAAIGDARAGRLWLVASVAACAAGMLCKESMVTAPVAVVLFDLAFLASTLPIPRSGFRLPLLRPRFHLALAFTWVPLAMILSGNPRAGAVGAGLHGVSRWDYLRTQFGVVTHYLALALWPSRLVLDDAWPLARRLSEWVPQAFLLTGLLAGAVWVWRRRPWAGYAGVFFFLALAPTSSVVPIVTEIAAEHRLYLPLAAVVVLAVAGIAALAGKLPVGLMTRRSLLAVLLTLALLAEGAATWRRNRDYASERTIWTDTVTKQPDNPRALINLARACEQAGEPTRALELLGRSLRVQPGSFEALYNRGTLLAKTGRALEGAESLEAATRVRPENTDALVNLGGARLLLGDEAGARAAYGRAVALNPGASGAHYNLGRLDAIAGNTDAACEHLDACLRADPNNAMARQLATAIGCSTAGTAR